MIAAQARTLPLFAQDASGALLSQDRRYRYRLWRAWGDIARRCVFVGLNPSTADEEDDDVTITRCIGIARGWGFGALDMVNLFALRSTNPKGLLLDADPVGPDNDSALGGVFGRAARVVWCWGDYQGAVKRLCVSRSAAVVFLAGAVVPLSGSLPEYGSLGRTKSGAPRHPSRLAYATAFVREVV